MQRGIICACAALVLLTSAFGQATKQKAKEDKKPASTSAQPGLNDLLESRIKAEWTAFKNRDKNAYGDLLADDFVAVENDGSGTRNKTAAVREVEQGLVKDYALAFFKVRPLGPDSAFVTYEVSVQFPAKAKVRFQRVYVSELWVKRDGQWKTLHYQETRVK